MKYFYGTITAIVIVLVPEENAVLVVVCVSLSGCHWTGCRFHCC